MLGNKKFVSEAEKQRRAKSFVGRYSRLVKSNSLLWFGVPVFGSMLVGTYLMSQFASVRYEQHDRHSQEVDQKEAFKDTKQRKVDLKDEYYRLQQLDLDNWENKRVKRLPGESENKW